ncbi:hypothetical protein AMJ39_06915 [candidate division TA06 bacterium DG_24]|uniref:Right handed beta helix domain-containing protein n=2 Tax=Bacteria division TA06 TaxID=1156500 RepID=A0A0S8JAJ4_UNCT6|nr:MAG: hypothetical protein AMJ39_06915 [candidate division TA06 bacterium DG_24]KPL05805.1 MAG: hypothetical protein AMJ71_10900 [candidate division TA06 bacterium SM1_40]
MEQMMYGDTILVAPGVYHEHDIAVRNGVYLTSEAGPEVTCIRAHGFGRVLYCEGSDSITVIEGFMIRGGSPASPDSFGGGILCIDASPTIRNNIIMKNTVFHAAPGTMSGGGIACLGGSPSIIANQIRWNGAFESGGGIYVGVGAAPLIVENAVRGNHSTCRGGGIAVEEGSAIIRDNVISNNAAVLGGGASIVRSTSVLIERNGFAENVSPVDRGGGMGITDTSSVTLILNKFVANSARNGGGLYSDATSTLIVNGTVFTDNRVGQRGGAIFSQGNLNLDASRISHNASGSSIGGVVCAGGNHIHNCVLYENDGDAVYNWLPVLDDVDATGNWWGDSTGPYHQLSNPRGQGESVGSHIDFDPWELEAPPLVLLDLFPTSTVLLRGEELTYAAQMSNITEEDHEGLFAAAVRIPEGPLVPALTPTQFVAPADSFVTLEVSHLVPQGAPLGTYLYIGKIGTSMSSIWDSASFSFDVVNGTFLGSTFHTEAQSDVLTQTLSPGGCLPFDWQEEMPRTWREEGISE